MIRPIEPLKTHPLKVKKEEVNRQLAHWLQTCREGFRRDVLDDLVELPPVQCIYTTARLLDLMGSEEQTNFRTHLERILAFEEDNAK